MHLSAPVVCAFVACGGLVSAQYGAERLPLDRRALHARDVLAARAGPPARGGLLRRESLGTMSTMPPPQALMARMPEAPSRPSSRRKARQGQHSSRPGPVIITIKIKPKGSHKKAKYLTGIKLPGHSAVKIPLGSYQGQKSGIPKHAQGKGRKNAKEYTKKQLAAINQLEKVQAFKQPNALKAALEMEEHQPSELKEIDPSFYDHGHTKEHSTDDDSLHAGSKNLNSGGKQHNQDKDKDILTDEEPESSSHAASKSEDREAEAEDEKEKNDSDNDNNDDDDDEKADKEFPIEDQPLNTTQKLSSKTSKGRVHAPHTFAQRAAEPEAGALDDPEVWI